MAYELPKLPYEFNALEPHIDAKTMEIHHTKHHQAYITKVNDALQGTEFENQTIEDVIANINQLPKDKQGAVRNNGGGHANHSLFWQILSSESGAPSGELAEDIQSTFGSFEKFQAAFANAGMTRFGSGWAWLTIDEGGKLCVCSTPNQDSPLMKGIAECPGKPILGLDVWEHAYYLNYQNRRPDYIKAFWNVVNWKKVGELYTAAKMAKA
ncbi:superoxide dismutase [PVC group bacterium]|nr:superoxide dismutase [PVC group bacterium]